MAYPFNLYVIQRYKSIHLQQTNKCNELRNYIKKFCIFVLLLKKKKKLENGVEQLALER